MMEEIEISNAAKETIYILNYISPEFVSKIPKYFIDELKELAKQSNIEVIIDKNKKLKEQNILEATKDLISLIYYSYIADDKEKEELTKIWNKNEVLYQEKLRERYNLDNIFRKKIKENSLQKNENLPILVEKESIIKRIINYIKNLFWI